MNVTKFVVKPSEHPDGTWTGKWYVLEVAGNGEPDGVTQEYTRKHDAKRSAYRKASRLGQGIPWLIVIED